MSPFAWCVLLLLAAVLLVFLEMLLPSAGVLSFLAAIAVLLAVAMAFVYYGPTTGASFFIGGLLVVFGVTAVAVKWYPHTPLGRLVIPEPPAEEDVLPSEELAELEALEGKVGAAETDLLPGGTVRVDGRSCDAVCQSGAVDAGGLVLVVRADGRRLVVRPAGERTDPQPDAPRGDDLLSQPIDWLSVEPPDSSSPEGPLA